MPATVIIHETIKINGINPYVLVRAEHAQKLQPGWRKPMPVIIQVNDTPKQPWHINMMPVGDGDFFLYLHNDVRTAASVKVGDSVTVTLQFDEAYRNGPQHDMPLPFKIALHANHTAQSNWELLPPSRQKEILRYFAGLKSEEALQRNIEKALHVLSGNSDRFMARDWKDGK